MEKYPFYFLGVGARFYQRLGRAILEVAAPQQLQTSCQGDCYIQTSFFLEGGSSLTRLFYDEASGQIGGRVIASWDEVRPLLQKGYELLQGSPDPTAKPLLRWFRLLLEEGGPGRFFFAPQEGDELPNPRRYLQGVVEAIEEALQRESSLPLFPVLRGRQLEHLRLVLFSQEGPIHLSVFHRGPLQELAQDEIYLGSSFLVLPGMEVGVEVRAR